MISSSWRSFLLLVGIVVMSGWVAAAQPPGGGAAQPPGGGFDFPEEEEDAPSWAEDIRAQALDIALVSAFSVLAFVSFFRKSVRLKYVTLIASVIYIGFWKSTLLSIVNVFALFGGNLPIFRYSLAWYLLAVITVVSTVLWGRVYCGRICAFGALTQLMDRVLPSRWRINIPRAIERRAAWIRYGILAGVLIYFIVTSDPGIYPYVEPFWMFGLHLRTPVLLALLGNAAHRHGLRPESVLPVSLSARGVSRNPVNADRLPHQAVVGVQDVQDLREGLRVGCDQGSADHHDRVRAV